MGFKLKKLIPKTGIKSVDNTVKRGIGNAAEMWGQKSPFKAPPPGPPGEDPQVTALREKMYNEANQFRSDMPGLMKDQESILKGDANKSIDTGVKAERANYNNRGLLYSGMRQGAEGDVKSRVASELARSTADVRKGYEDTARAKENAAAQVGLSGYQDALRRAEDTFNMQLAKNVQSRQQMQQLGQAGGYAAGTYASGGFNRQAAAQPPPTYYDRYSQNQNGYYTPASYYGQGLMA